MTVEIPTSVVSFNHLFPHAAAYTTHAQTPLVLYLLREKLLSHISFNMIIQDVIMQEQVS